MVNNLIVSFIISAMIIAFDIILTMLELRDVNFIRCYNPNAYLILFFVYWAFLFAVRFVWDYVCKPKRGEGE